MNDFTVGVEEEYQLVDAETGALRSGARAVLDTDWSGAIRREMHQSTIEIGTSVCTSSAAVDAELRTLRMQAATAAAAEDLRIVAAGGHPFAAWRDHHRMDGDRYARMAGAYGRIARDEHNFGTHIHVGVATDRAVVMGVVRRFLPHLLALSCSSPYHEGEDTGYASFRTVLWRRWPSAGVPPRFRSEAEFDAFVGSLLRAGVIGDARNLYWMIRPHPEYPTLEFRVCDACPRLEDTVALAGLARVLVHAAAGGALPEPDRDWTDSARDAVLADDVWRVARYGLEARLVEPAVAAGFETARDALRRLIDGLAGVAAGLGEADALGGVATILERGNGTDRIRAYAAGAPDLADVTLWLAAETELGAGLDRRRATRTVAQDTRGSA
jgi:glutamate---cysteine ligase / carboxylate-amine ligase